MTTPREILRKIGYRGFGEYVRSPRFKRLRLEVLRRHGYCCAHCGERAGLVRWVEFTEGNLRGNDLRGVDAICDACWDAWKGVDSVLDKVQDVDRDEGTHQEAARARTKRARPRL